MSNIFFILLLSFNFLKLTPILRAFQILLKQTDCWVIGNDHFATKKISGHKKEVGRLWRVSGCEELSGGYLETVWLWWIKWELIGDDVTELVRVVVFSCGLIIKINNIY
jgi:hypothetical protein